MNKVDNFFKKKIEATTIEPRAEAWAKLEANLSKKNKGLIWLRMAAALLLAGMLVTTIMWLQNKGGEQQITEQVKKELPEKITEKSSGNDPVQTENKSVVKSRTIDAQKQNTLHRLNPQIKEVEPDSVAIDPIEPDAIQTESVAAATVVEKPIKIEYTLASIPMRKKEAPVLAETDEKKNSLQKALDFAREAKNSDSPLGELRQAKDDLFALNFKKDKQKKQ